MSEETEPSAHQIGSILKASCGQERAIHIVNSPLGPEAKLATRLFRDCCI